MKVLSEAKRPFQFSTRLHLSILTGLRAANLKRLLELIKSVPGACIYHHTHRFLQQHQYLSPEPPNDFAYWVTEVLGESDLGERLASIDTVRFSSIHDLRKALVVTIQHYLHERPEAKKRVVRVEEQFNFIKSMSFVLVTPYTAKDIKEFAEVLRKITIDSIYYHIFESKLRLEKGRNDFSIWIETEIGDQELADQIAGMDPYTQTLEDLRNTIVHLIQKKYSPAE